MKSLSLGTFAVAALLCATPISLHCSHGKSLSVSVDSADAADLTIPSRHRAVSYGYHSRLYDPYCNGPYTGGGWNGGTYYGGPWMLLHCYGIAPEAYAPARYAPVNYYGYDYGYSPGYSYGY